MLPQTVSVPLCPSFCDKKLIYIPWNKHVFQPEKKMKLEWIHLVLDDRTSFVHLSLICSIPSLFRRQNSKGMLQNVQNRSIMPPPTLHSFCFIGNLVRTLRLKVSYILRIIGLNVSSKIQYVKSTIPSRFAPETADFSGNSRSPTEGKPTQFFT